MYVKSHLSVIGFQGFILFAFNRKPCFHHFRKSSNNSDSFFVLVYFLSQLVATVLHQSHLCPLPLTSQPISWPLDHVLRLYPLPHTVVLADRLIQKVFNYTGVTSFSPGSFSHDGAFIAYRPGTKEAEISSI
ncbi:hypothetical protein Mapa_014737 [Marchantia paleacea]|nr:hypothetical protein Mapa_014737 [Marchantia paleacea]